MCSDLSEIFHYVQPTLDDFILYDKNKPIPAFEQNDAAAVASLPTENVAKTSILNELSNLQDMVSPSNVLYPGDKIPHYAISSTYKKGEYLDVSIGEIYDLSKFWIYDTFGELKPLMNDLQIFFHNQHNKYLIPELLLEEGLYCTCLYAGEFHRAVLFVDYGTVGNVQSNKIWYLPKQFAKVPCQAIRASLSNIYPAYENQPWNIAALNRFQELITNTPLVAEIVRIIKEDNILEVYLADINNEDNIFYINDVLVKEGHALYID
ncbi:uncharacterized protein BDFB_011154, partial [Asbolus verrucosus]